MTLTVVYPETGDCTHCNGTRWIQYNTDHAVLCPHCCQHGKGFYTLEDGPDKGKLCCVEGCGKIVDKLPAMG